MKGIRPLAIGIVACICSVILQPAATALSRGGGERNFFELLPEAREGSILEHEFQSRGSNLVYRKADFQVEVPETADKGIDVRFGNVKLLVRLEGYNQLNRTRGRDGEVRFEGKQSVHLLLVPKVDRSVQFLITMLDASAPTRYEFLLDSFDYDRLEVQSDGSVVALDRDGKFVFGIAPPWARDANGQTVPTRFLANGKRLIQLVKVDEAEGPVQFPVIADPWLGIDLYSSVWLTFPPSGYVVHATPSTWGKIWVGSLTWSAHVNEVKSKAGLWNASIENQLLCHLLGFPLSLPTYDLESWRPNVDYATSLVKYQCNPGPGAGGSY